MNGCKLVSDYLTDRKRNYFQRQGQLVLCDASGDILWLVGERVSAHAAITTDTINMLRIRYY
jgi:tRNA(Ile)-lysidine synthase